MLNSVAQTLFPCSCVTFMPFHSLALSMGLPVSLRIRMRAEPPALASSGRRS